MVTVATVCASTPMQKMNVRNQFIWLQIEKFLKAIAVFIA